MAKTVWRPKCATPSQVPVPTADEAEDALQDGNAEILARYLLAYPRPSLSIVQGLARALSAKGETLYRLKFERRSRGKPKTPALDRAITDAFLAQKEQEQFEKMPGRAVRKRSAELAAKEAGVTPRRVRTASERKRRVPE